MIDEEQSISIYLVERGPAKPPCSEILNNYFTSCLFKIEVGEESYQRESFHFYSFANDQNITIGHKNLSSLKLFADKSKLQIKI